MKLLLLSCIILLSCASNSQDRFLDSSILKWQKAVVNVENQSFIHTRFHVRQVLASMRARGIGIDSIKIDSIKLSEAGTRHTGTAIYGFYKGRKYLITAKHVLFDDSLSAQMKYENQTLKTKWNYLEAMTPYLAILTPFDYYIKNPAENVNDFAVAADNYSEEEQPYFFIPNKLGDGIGVISLQDSSYRPLDSILQRNGYTPINIEDACINEPLNVLDEIYAIGFPELISVQGTTHRDDTIPPNQSLQIVTSFIVKGNIAMYDPNIDHYFVDLTITPGNSGSPIIKNGKLVGIVSGINKYSIIDENNSPTSVYGIGHLVTVVNINSLVRRLEEFRSIENKILKRKKK